MSIMQDIEEEQAVTAVLRQYGEAAGRSDAVAVAALYADDGVLMAQNAPTQIGNAAVRAAYEGMFAAIRLDIAFSIAEVQLLGADWAFLRSTSAGTIRLLATDTDVPEANQELFLFHKAGGTWKIARYCFSTVLPA